MISADEAYRLGLDNWVVPDDQLMATAEELVNQILQNSQQPVSSAKETILDVVKSNPQVITEPAPTVVFQTFGDSSLNFVVRCCISGPDKRLSTIHDLQVAINKRLAEKNIVIPFPQRVVHAVSDKPMEQSSTEPNGAAAVV